MHTNLMIEPMPAPWPTYHGAGRGDVLCPVCAAYIGSTATGPCPMAHQHPDPAARVAGRRAVLDHRADSATVARADMAHRRSVPEDAYTSDRVAAAVAQRTGGLSTAGLAADADGVALALSMGPEFRSVAHRVDPVRRPMPRGPVTAARTATVRTGHRAGAVVPVAWAVHTTPRPRWTNVPGAPLPVVSMAADGVPWSALPRTTARYPYVLARKLRAELPHPVADRHPADVALMRALMALDPVAVRTATVTPPQNTRPEVLALPIGGVLPDAPNTGADVLTARARRARGPVRALVPVKLPAPIGGLSAAAALRASMADRARTSAVLSTLPAGATRAQRRAALAALWGAPVRESRAARATVKSGRVTGSAWLCRPFVTAGPVLSDGSDHGADRDPSGRPTVWTVGEDAVVALMTERDQRRATVTLWADRVAAAFHRANVRAVTAGAAGVTVGKSTGRPRKLRADSREAVLRAAVTFTPEEDAALAAVAGKRGGAAQRRRTAVLDSVAARAAVVHAAR